ncbi:MAG: outer membrane beta-barrel protein [Bacteroidales bacterium]|nr:outer membrane beta-barrel protein [Bacteroidales bacterium]
MVLKFLMAAFILSFPLIVLAQEKSTCAENLKASQLLFDKGQVEQVSSMLRECMKSGFNREEQLSAYKLLIQSYLFEDKLEQADSAMLAFLRSNPEYQLSPTDHSSFVFLFNNFKVEPLVKISVHLGTNYPFLTLTDSDPASVASEKSSNKYSSGLLNFYGSIEAKFEIRNNIEANIEVGYSQLSFTNKRDFLGIGTTSYIENQSRLEIPLSATFNFRNFGKFTPYARLGAGPALSLGTIATADFKPSDLNGTSHTGSDINREASRISLDLFAQAGAGIKFKTPGGYIFSELRSGFGFYNQVIHAGTSPEEQELAFYYYYADDAFNLNAINFTIGYTQIFYKPSKK